MNDFEELLDKSDKRRKEDFWIKFGRIEKGERGAIKKPRLRIPFGETEP